MRPFQFWILGTVAVIGALCTVLMKKAVHSALCLAGTMIILAVFYLANGAYFLGIVQVVVYTGAIMMLFLFVVMLVGVTAADSLKETIKGQRWLAAAVRARLRHPADRRHRQRLPEGASTASARPTPSGNVEGLAALIFTKYVFAFEITGALLITAAVGAMVLTHRERTERAKTQRELSEERVREQAPAAAARPRCLRPAQRGGHRGPAARRHPVRAHRHADAARSAARSATCPPSRSTTSRRWNSAPRSGSARDQHRPRTGRPGRAEEASK